MTDDIKCPKCGGKTKLCTRIEDGQKFYVCVDYPRCKGGVAFDKESNPKEDSIRSDLRNPLLLSVKMFLADVRSWYHQYIEGRYVCSDFSQEVVHRATERGMRCGYVVISFEKSPIGHAIIVFETDYGLVYIEPQSGEEIDVKIGTYYPYISDGISKDDCIKKIEIKWNDGTVTNF